MMYPSTIKVGGGLSLEVRRQKADRDGYRRLPVDLNDPTFLIFVIQYG